jgi:YHS domain-containing protein
MKLADMGKPYVFAYKGREIKLCDKSEKADFEKAPAKYLTKLDEARAKLKK